MTPQIPNGPKGLVCPFRGKSMDRVCSTCPLWKLVRGRNSNTGEQVDQWDCSLAWLPGLLIEVSQQARSGAAATESFRNEMTARADDRVRRIASPTTQATLLIEAD